MDTIVYVVLIDKLENLKIWWIQMYMLFSTENLKILWIRMLLSLLIGLCRFQMVDLENSRFRGFKCFVLC